MTDVISFDFDAKVIHKVKPQDVAAAVAKGRYCWIDIEDAAEAESVLSELNVSMSTIERVTRDRTQGQFVMGRSSVHFTLVETGLKGKELQLSALHVVLGDGFLATIHSQPSPVLKNLHETYEDDFYASARSGGFLLFELADYLISGYRATLSDMSKVVEDIQSQLLGEDGDDVLEGLSTQLTRSLLDYRNAVVTARETIYELATRRSPFVSESTQPFLDRQTNSLERLAADAATERTVLSEVLNLYMGIVSHRTNRVVDRLTIVSLIFLPLNFLAAVYGMNFDIMPELQWKYGYLAFWGVVTVMVTSLILVIRFRRWI
ncbi:MAG: magnesium transporter CorA family protein [Alphaproteobacteria bacterium]|nr:magnesium transporter CorA family protein [Alphaproteobacteria bacterium]